MGRFQTLIAQLWPDHDQPNALLPAGLDDDAAVQLALALEQTGHREDAIRVLLAHKPSGTDVLGVLAGRLKRRWWLARKADDLQSARDLYQRGHDQATKKTTPDYDQASYHGINLAYLALAADHDFGAAREIAERVLVHCAKALDLGVESGSFPPKATHCSSSARARKAWRNTRKLPNNNWKPGRRSQWRNRPSESPIYAASR